MKNNESDRGQAEKKAADSPITLSIVVDDLLDFEGQAAAANPPDHAAIDAIIKRQFAFLPQRLKIEVGDDVVRVSFPRESAAARSKAKRMAERGARLAAAGHVSSAITILKESLEVQPSSFGANQDLGMAYFEAGDLDLARRHTIRALLLDPGDAKSWVILGVITGVDQHETPRAETFMRRALALSPRYPWALSNLADLVWRRGDIEEAISLSREAIACRPEHPNSYYNLAVLYRAKDELTQAIRVLDEMFAKARMQDVRSRTVFDQARALAADIRTTLAEG